MKMKPGLCPFFNNPLLSCIPWTPHSQYFKRPWIVLKLVESVRVGSVTLSFGQGGHLRTDAESLPSVFSFCPQVLKCGISSGFKAELVVNVDNPSEHKIWAELAKNTSGVLGG